MLTLPETFERNQWLIDLMTAPGIEQTFDEAETLGELMLQYDAHPAEPIREKILRLQAFLLTQPQVEVPVRHYINNGIYYREITIPQGAFCTGSVYKEAHIHFLICGDMTVLTEDGVKRVTGPCTFVSPPNMKRAGYAHSETIWAAVFPNPNNETNPEVIMESLIKKDSQQENL